MYGMNKGMIWSIAEMQVTETYNFKIMPDDHASAGNA